MLGKHRGLDGPTAVLLACVQSAIASTPSAAWQGYLLGGMMWFCIPFTLSTSLGLATVALDLPLSTDEANMGLVPIAAASVRVSSQGQQPACWCMALRGNAWPASHVLTQEAQGTALGPVSHFRQ